MGYLGNFIVYTLAMVGVMMLALIVFKKTTSANSRKNSKILKVHDVMNLGPRKSLYIVSAGEEKFLIAGDAERTTLISKLGEQNRGIENQRVETITKNNIPSKTDEDMAKIIEKFSSKKSSYMDKSIVGINSSQINRNGLESASYSSVMKNLADKMNVKIREEV